MPLLLIIIGVIFLGALVVNMMRDNFWGMVCSVVALIGTLVTGAVTADNHALSAHRHSCEAKGGTWVDQDHSYTLNGRTTIYPVNGFGVCLVEEEHG